MLTQGYLVIKLIYVVVYAYLGVSSDQAHIYEYSVNVYAYLGNQGYLVI